MNLFILRKRFREFLTVYAINDFERTDLADGTEACAPLLILSPTLYPLNLQFLERGNASHGSFEFGALFFSSPFVDVVLVQRADVVKPRKAR